MAFFFIFSSLTKNWNIIKLSTNYRGQPLSLLPKTGHRVNFFNIFLHNTLSLISPWQ